mmetsp:Transcript_149122/g.460536  ORF Transcript_149122/g.460536 Transcript_149122/m.460536 type:complete len:203 (-) Transcript_149122:328-936(-)
MPITMAMDALMMVLKTVFALPIGDMLSSSIRKNATVRVSEGTLSKSTCLIVEKRPNLRRRYFAAASLRSLACLTPLGVAAVPSSARLTALSRTEPCLVRSSFLTSFKGEVDHPGAAGTSAGLSVATMMPSSSMLSSLRTRERWNMLAASAARASFFARRSLASSFLLTRSTCTPMSGKLPEAAPPGLERCTAWMAAIKPKPS